MPFPTIPGLPSGWKVIDFQQSTTYPCRDAVVLCENTDNQHTPFVCWLVNMIEGGCHMGDYGNYREATSSFTQRKMRLR